MVDYNQIKIGQGAIDQQHKKLFETIEKLITSSKGGHGRDEILKTLEFLNIYAKQHFNMEEALMEKRNYTKYAAHKREHDFFKMKVDEMIKKTQEGVVVSDFVQLNHFVNHWLINHIMEMDMKLKEIL